MSETRASEYGKTAPAREWKLRLFAVPTLFRTSPKPTRVLIGDFSKVETVLKGLDAERWVHG